MVGRDQLAYQDQKEMCKRLAQMGTNPNIPSIGKRAHFEDSFAHFFCDDLTGIDTIADRACQNGITD